MHGHRPVDQPAVICTQQAHIAVDARGQHRRAAADRFGNDQRAAFAAAGVHQQVGALDAAPCFAVVQPGHPAVVRAGCCHALGFAPQRRIERVPDVLDLDAGIGRDLPQCAPEHARVFFFPQVTDHHHAQQAPAFAQVLARRAGLHDHAGLLALGGGQDLQRPVLQHHQRMRLRQ